MRLTRLIHLSISLLISALALMIGFLPYWIGEARADDGVVCETRVLTYTFSTEAETDDFYGNKCYDSSQHAIKTGSGNGATSPPCYDTPFANNHMYISKSTILERLNIVTDINSLDFSAHYSTVADPYASYAKMGNCDVPGIPGSNCDYYEGGAGDDVIITRTNVITFDALEFYQYFNNSLNPDVHGWIDDINIYVNACYVEDDGGATCTTVQDHHFTASITDTPWLLQNSTVASSAVTIGPAGAVAQNITATLLQSNRDYNAVVSVTNIISTSEITLHVALGSSSYTLTITSTGIYTAQVRTGNIGGPLAYILYNEDGAVEINWTCLSLASSTESDTCYGPPNGEFNSSSSWLWREGASFNESTKSAYIPMNDPETHSDPFYTPAYIISSDSFTMPTVPDGQYLILKFDAQALNNQNGLLTTLVSNISSTNRYTLTYEIYPQKYTFETDVSQLSDEEIGMLFGVNGGYPPAVTYPDDVNLDNVCFFLSNSPPSLPYPVDPDNIAPVNPGSLYTCGDIGSILYGLVGVDLRYHHANYNNTPSVWDPNGWVPWLISAWWVMVETILCFFFVIINSIINLLTYFINEFLNWFNWIRRNAELIIPWIGLWFWAIVGTLKNFGSFINETFWNWLYWAAASTVELAGTWPQLVANLATIALWIFSGFWWLGGLFIPLILFFLAGGSNVVREIFNWLIENGWNGTIESISTVASNILNDAAWIWNENLKPFFELILRALFGPIISLFALFYAIWGLIWAVVLYLWENVFQSINIPFAFYTGFNSGVQSAAFSSLMSCDGSVSNFWCNLFAGLDLLNGVAGQSIFYPIVIVGIVIATIVILYKNVTALWNFYAEFITKI